MAQSNLMAPTILACYDMTSYCSPVLEHGSHVDMRCNGTYGFDDELTVPQRFQLCHREWHSRSCCSQPFRCAQCKVQAALAFTSANVMLVVYMHLSFVRHWQCRAWESAQHRMIDAAVPARYRSRTTRKLRGTSSPLHSGDAVGCKQRIVQPQT